MYLKLLLSFFVFGLQVQNVNLNTAQSYKSTFLPRNSATNKISFTKNISATGTQNQIYKKALAWVNQLYPGSSKALQLADSVNGRIIFTGVLPAKIQDIKVDVRHTMQITVSDGFAKAEITELSYFVITKQITFEEKENELKKRGNTERKRIFEPMVKKVDAAIASFEKFIK